MRYDSGSRGRRRPGVAAKQLAYGLGWFSIGLGFAELLAPRSLARATGMQGSEPVLRAYGLREIVNGLGILAADDPTPWVWARVAGDALDLATLATGLDRDNPRRENVEMAIGAVAGVTALDVLCAQMLGSSGRVQPRRPIRYAYRSGFPAPPEQMRGAASDFELPEDFRTPEALRPWDQTPA